MTRKKVKKIKPGTLLKAGKQFRFWRERDKLVLVVARCDEDDERCSNFRMVWPDGSREYWPDRSVDGKTWILIQEPS